MALKFWRFAALMLAALTMGLGFCHLMEMPARMTWDQSLWVGSTVHGGLYRMFGTLGAAIDVAAIICLVVVAWRVRHHGRNVFWLSALAAAFFIIPLLLWFVFVAPVNAELANWLKGPVPADWAAWRAQWETAHSVNTVIQILGYSALIWSVLVETPDEIPDLANEKRQQMRRAA